LLSACSKFQTARECGSFVEAIKTWKGQARPAASVPITSPSAASVESRSLADRYDDLATRIDALHLTSSELVPRARRYQKLSREAAHCPRRGAAGRRHQRRLPLTLGLRAGRRSDCGAVLGETTGSPPFKACSFLISSRNLAAVSNCKFSAAANISWRSSKSRSAMSCGASAPPVAARSGRLRSPAAALPPWPVGTA
jgi:hypothetical protein